MGRRKHDCMPGMEYFWIKEYLRVNPIQHPVDRDTLLSQLRRMYKDGHYVQFKKWYAQLKKHLVEKRGRRLQCFDALRSSRCFKFRLFRLRILQRARNSAKTLFKRRQKDGQKRGIISNVRK